MQIKQKLNLEKLSKWLLLCLMVAIASFCISRRADWNFSLSGMANGISSMAAGRHNLDMPDRRYGLLLWLNTVDVIDPWEISFADMNRNTIRIYDKPELWGGGYEEYISQLGLHGWVYFLIGKYIPSPLWVTQAGLCVLLAIVLSLICFELFKKYGILSAAIFFFITSNTHWIADFAPSLFYTAFLWFIPMLLGLICLNNIEKRRLLYPLFFLSILIKSLCIYEHLPVVMLSSVMFLIAEWLLAIRTDKQYSRLLLKTIIIIGLLELLAVAVTFVIHSYLRGDGNIFVGMESIFYGDILRRTHGGTAALYGLVDGDITVDSFNASVFTVLALYLWEGFTGKFALFLLCSVLCIMIYRHIFKRQRLDIDFWLFVMSFITCISWFVLAKSSAYVHTHYDLSMWYMGFIQICIWIIAKIVIKNIFHLYSIEYITTKTTDLIGKLVDGVHKEVTRG